MQNSIRYPNYRTLIVRVAMMLDPSDLVSFRSRSSNVVLVAAASPSAPSPTPACTSAAPVSSVIST